MSDRYVQLTSAIAGWYPKGCKFKVVQSREEIDGTHDGRWIGINTSSESGPVTRYAVELKGLLSNYHMFREVS